MSFKGIASRTDWWTGSKEWEKKNTQQCTLVCEMEFVKGLEEYGFRKSV